jgi:hypothetical protein
MAGSTGMNKLRNRRATPTKKRLSPSGEWKGYLKAARSDVVENESVMDGFS